MTMSDMDTEHRGTVPTTRWYDRYYDQPGLPFGTRASAELIGALREHGPCRPVRRALDLGAGLGRNSFALIERGFTVDAIDISYVAMRRLRQQAEQQGLSNRIRTQTEDITDYPWPVEAYAAIVAATVLDQLPIRQGLEVLFRIQQALIPGGLAYLEVLTTEDPGYLQADRASECAPTVTHYFKPNELLDLCRPLFRTLTYREFRETDTSHGPTHEHAKAVLVGRVDERFNRKEC